MAMNGRREQGYTLVELLVVLVLMGIVLMAINSFFLTNYRSYATTSSELNLQTGLALINERLAADIRRAELVEISGQQLIITQGTEKITYIYDSTSQQLLRNGQPLTAAEIKIESLSWQSQTGAEGYTITWQIRGRSNSSALAIKMAESPRRLKI